MICEHKSKKVKLYSIVPSDWATGHSLEGRSYLSAEMQSVYSTTPSDWATGHSLEGRSYLSAEMQSVYSTTPSD